MKKWAIVVEAIIILILVSLGVLYAFKEKDIRVLDSYYSREDSHITIKNDSVDVRELVDSLSVFYNLKQVDFVFYKIPREEYDFLTSSYNDVLFNGVIIENVYGLSFENSTKELDLTSTLVTNDLINVLSLFPNLEKVKLKDNNLTKEELVKLKETYPNVFFEMQLSFQNIKTDTYVRTLDFSNLEIKNIDELYLFLKLLPELTYLDMSNTNLSNEDLAKLNKAFPNIKVVWEVKLGKWKLKTDAVAFSVLIVDYNYKRMTEDDIQVLKYCNDLQALDLGHQSIKDISVIGDYLKELRVLILADNKISDITPLKNLSNLHYLELFMNNINDISILNNNKSLVDLNLSFNPLDGNIEPLINIEKLERLWIVNTPKITKDKINTLKEKYPKVQIVTTGKGSTGSGWRTHERYYKMINMYHNNYIDEVFTKYDI